MSSDRPNILIIIPHDLGDFLGCYGNSSVHSPNLDGLAREGVRFTNCFTTCPECTASRGSLLTGLQPHQNGLMGLAGFGWNLRVPHLAARMKESGYVTRLFGFQHETREDPETLGYMHVHHGKGKRADAVCRDLCDFLGSPDSRNSRPWFACAGFSHVHRPWTSGDATRYDPAAVAVPAWLPEHPVVRKDLARFHQDIEDMDRAVGGVLDSLRTTGLAEKTLVVFTTDHGAAFPGAKATLYDPGIHVPLIMHQPGRFEGGESREELISNMDLTPTLLQSACAEIPEGLDGRSFLPLLEGGNYQEREFVAGALFYDVAYDPMHYVRNRTHKYMRSFAVTDADTVGADKQTLSTFAAGRWIRVDDLDVLTSPTWQALSPGADRARPEREELYDLRVDPYERRNLAQTPEARPVLDAMRQVMKQMMQETQSPLLNGHVPPPTEQREASARLGPGTQRFRDEVAARKALL